MSTEKRKDFLLEALVYRRHTGASLDDIRTYAQIRMEGTHRWEADLKILLELTAAGVIYPVGKKWFLTIQAYDSARGLACEPEWEHADAWVMLAVIYRFAKAPVMLDQIVAAADFINHAIPTLEELHGGLNRLLAGGLIRMKDGGFVVTPKGLELYAKVESCCRHTVLAQYAGLERILSCPCCGVRLKAVRWRLRLDEQAFKRAYNEYAHKTNKM